MSSHVPGEIPFGWSVRQAVQTDGATCSTNEVASAVPSQARPPAAGRRPGVQRLTSTIVMKRVVDDRPLPLEAAAGHGAQRARPRRNR